MDAHAEGFESTSILSGTKVQFTRTERKEEAYLKVPKRV